MFPPDDLWFGSDTHTNYAVIYDLYLDVWLVMMKSSNGNIFCFTGHLCREFTGHQ